MKINSGGQAGRSAGSSGKDAEGGHQAERGVVSLGHLCLLSSGRLASGVGDAGRDVRFWPAAQSQVSPIPPPSKCGITTNALALQVRDTKPINSSRQCWALLGTTGHYRALHIPLRACFFVGTSFRAWLVIADFWIFGDVMGLLPRKNYISHRKFELFFSSLLFILSFIEREEGTK